MFRYLFLPILIIAMCVSSVSAFPGLGEIEKAIEKVVDKGVQRVEAKIDGFVQEEVRKVKHQLMVLYIVMILISMAYSTVLIFVAKRYLTRSD